MARAIDVILECETAYNAIGSDYATLVCETCFVSGNCVLETNSVYNDMKKLYESQTDFLHKIIITDKPTEYQHVVESIKNRIAYIFIPVASEVVKHYILQDYFSLFDYISRVTSDNYKKCKSSYCKKCKSVKIRKMKLENRSRYWQIGKLCEYLNSEYYNIKHVCAGNSA